MKNNFTLLLIITLLFVGCKKDDLKLEEDKEKTVVKIEAFLIPYKFGKPSDKDKVLWESQEFNSKGELTAKKWRPNMRIDDVLIYNPIWSEAYTLKDGKVIEVNQKYSGERRIVYKYEGDNIVESIEYGSGGISTVEEYEYNNNLKTKAIVYWKNRESLSSTDILTYDSRDNLINILRKYEGSGQGANLIYEYDSRNNLMKESYNDIAKGTTNVQKLYKYNYDNQGRISEYIHPGPYMWEFFKEIFTYDKEGRLESKKIYNSKDIDGKYEEYADLIYKYTFN